MLRARLLGGGRPRDSDRRQGSTVPRASGFTSGLGPSPPQSRNRPPRLGALALLLAVPLDLPAHVSRELVDRGPHRRRGLLRAQRRSLQVESRLRDLVVGDRRVALLVELDLEGRRVRDLPADSAERLANVLTQLLGDLDVATTYFDAHCPSWVTD